MKAAEEKVAVVQEQLSVKKAELQKLIDQNNELQEEFRVQNQEKLDLVA